MPLSRPLGANPHPSFNISIYLCINPINPQILLHSHQSKYCTLLSPEHPQLPHPPELQPTLLQHPPTTHIFRRTKPKHPLHVPLALHVLNDRLCCLSRVSSPLVFWKNSESNVWCRVAIWWIALHEAYGANRERVLMR